MNVMASTRFGDNGFTWLLVHLFFLIGFRNRLLVLIQYAWKYFTFQNGSRVILPAYAKSTFKAPGHIL
jgi:NADH:ubiquinone reductase (H+-translocating)